MKNLNHVALMSLALALPAFAGVSVSSPKSGETVSSPTTFVASASTSCSKGVASMGVYVDNKLVYVAEQTSFSAPISMSSGKHNTVVEEWDKCGSASYQAVDNITVAGGSDPVSGPPSNATSSGDLDSGHWAWNHDAGTPGYSVGYSAYAVASPSIDSAAREFSVYYSRYGGEIYHLTFGNDAEATHFIYDTYVYLVDPAQIANIELDVNQVTSYGETVILGTQCSSYSGTWEFASVSGGKPHWHPSNLYCNPKSWSAYAWHHIQVASHRNGGTVVHDWVSVDGDKRYFDNASGFAGLYLHWSPGDLLLNFQLDGAYAGSGSMKVYIDKLIIDRW